MDDFDNSFDQQNVRSTGTPDFDVANLWNDMPLETNFATPQTEPVESENAPAESESFGQIDEAVTSQPMDFAPDSDVQSVEQNEALYDISEWDNVPQDEEPQWTPPEAPVTSAPEVEAEELTEIQAPPRTEEEESFVEPASQEQQPQQEQQDWQQWEQWDQWEPSQPQTEPLTEVADVDDLSPEEPIMQDVAEDEQQLQDWQQWEQWQPPEPQPETIEEEILPEPMRVEDYYEAELLPEPMRLEENYEAELLPEPMRVEENYKAELLPEPTRLEENYEAELLPEPTRLEENYEAELLPEPTIVQEITQQNIEEVLPEPIVVQEFTELNVEEILPEPVIVQQFSEEVLPEQVIVHDQLPAEQQPIVVQEPIEAASVEQPVVQEPVEVVRFEQPVVDAPVEAVAIEQPIVQVAPEVVLPEQPVVHEVVEAVVDHDAAAILRTDSNEEPVRELPEYAEGNSFETRLDQHDNDPYTSTQVAAYTPIFTPAHITIAAVPEAHSALAPEMHIAPMPEAHITTAAVHDVHLPTMLPSQTPGALLGSLRALLDAWMTDKAVGGSTTASSAGKPNRPPRLPLQGGIQQTATTAGATMPRRAVHSPANTPKELSSNARTNNPFAFNPLRGPGTPLEDGEGKPKRTFYRRAINRGCIRRLTGVEIALVAMLSASAIARDMNTKPTVIGRARHPISAGGSLKQIAEMIYGDSQLALLIAEINCCRTKQTQDKDNLIVTVAEGTSLELPNVEDVRCFKLQSKTNAQTNVVTIVEQNSLRRDAVSSLATAMGCI